MQKIIFHSNHLNNLKSKELYPVPARKIFPLWFSHATRYAHGNKMNKVNLEQNILTFKACPAISDIFFSGYVLLTPCDINVINIENTKKIIVGNNFKDFCGERPADQNLDFPVPSGHLNKHFFWYPDWSVELPQGHSALYVNPINRFDLPFTTVSGIVDSDSFVASGHIPFFIQNDFEGLIPKGTPYLQIFPFKRDEWISEYKNYSIKDIKINRDKFGKLFRIPEGGVYKKIFWKRKKYE